MRVDFRTLRAGETFRVVHPLGGGLGPVRTFVRLDQTRARGYWVATIAERVPGAGNTVSFQTGDEVEVDR